MQNAYLQANIMLDEVPGDKSSPHNVVDDKTVNGSHPEAGSSILTRFQILLTRISCGHTTRIHVHVNENSRIYSGYIHLGTTSRTA